MPEKDVLQTLLKQDLLKGEKTEKLKLCEHCVMENRPKLNLAPQFITLR